MNENEITDEGHIYKLLHQQNQQLDKMRNTYSVEGNNITYMNTQLHDILYWNNILFYVYLIFAIIVIGIMFMQSKSSIYVKIFYTLMIIVYPFVILYIESGLYYAYSYLLTMTNGTAFAPPNQTFFSTIIS